MHGLASLDKNKEEIASSEPISLWLNSSLVTHQGICRESLRDICKIPRLFVSCLLVILGSFILLSDAYPQEIEVVVNPSVSKEDLSRNALRAIFGMRLRTWPDGTPIRVFVLGEYSQIHAQFAKKKLGIFPHQLQRAWDRLVFSGTGQAPFEISSAKEMHAKIASTSGAIGYLPKEMINDDVRVVEVE